MTEIKNFMDVSRGCKSRLESKPLETKLKSSQVTSMIFDLKYYKNVLMYLA